MTAQQQQRIQDMMNSAFEARMKKEIYPNDNIEYLKSKFKTVIHFFGFNTINIRANELKALLDKKMDYSYFEAGTMLNCVMSASFEKNELLPSDTIIHFMEKLEGFQDVYNEFVNKCRKSSQAEVKTKLQLANDPLAKFL